jgi:hypothetical protein
MSPRRNGSCNDLLLREIAGLVDTRVLGR